MLNEAEFKKYLIEVLGSSKATSSAYLADVKEFDEYLDKKKILIENLSGDNIKDFLNSLKNSGRSNSTMNRKMVSIRKYIEFLRNTAVLSTDPSRKIKVPKVEPKQLEYLSLEEIEKLLSQPGDDAKGLRDRAILELLYACGLKVTELTSLNVQDVDLRIGFVSCRTDKSKNRIIPMGHPARQALLTYMKDARNELLADKKDSGALFVNYNGERITRQGVWKILKLYGKKAGISEDLSPQLIRNSFAAHMIMNGADLKSLQELLGNEDLSTTRLFLSLSKARVMDVYDKTHPRA